VAYFMWEEGDVAYFMWEEGVVAYFMWEEGVVAYFMWEEEVVAYFKMLSQNVPGGTYKDHKMSIRIDGLGLNLNSAPL